MRLIRLALIVSAVVLATGCASVRPVIAELPAQVEATDRNLKAAVGNLQQLLTLTARTADTISEIEDTAARAGTIPAKVDAQFDRVMLAYATASEAASHRLVTGAVQTWPQLRAIVGPVLEQGQRLIDMAGSIGAIRSRVKAFLVSLRDGLSAAAGEFAFGTGGAQ